ncbi:hypothetical protein PFICI_05286 [Pestalotiopsis fici W106-1]|uniref:AAA+ ATPase domain-containing protein n=1 Tax=Pestalotiopsis fici (strain W106-1 / CGMCC3.15140) TaxID=1229662 RepID=W3XBJ3_PESFW|nr:uncharacterized protein PFICI_05286 [Pestalotiopsis fici W106-1]ETS83410.1 hypothetical protein PFICI_05286 [Pestalotiopsis fici W106-1]
MDGTGEADADAKKIHPFFSATKNTAPSIPVSAIALPVTPDPSCSPGSDKLSARADASINILDDNEPAQGRTKRRKTDSDAEPEESKPQRKRGRPKGKTKPKVAEGINIAEHFGQKNDATHKKPEVQGEPCNDGTLQTDTHSKMLHSAQPVPQAQPPSAAVDAQPAETSISDKPSQESKPKKLLKFNPKTGTIGSPPKSKAQNMDESVPDQIPAARPRRSKKGTSLLVHIRYGHDDAARTRIAEKIEEIFSGVRYISAKNSKLVASQLSGEQSSSAPSQEAPSKRSLKKDQTLKAAKAAHPFFNSKSKTTVTTTTAKELPKSPSKKQSIFTSTPCSPKQIRQKPTKFNFPQFGPKSGGTKFPGAQQAAWPWKGMVHIHGDERDTNPFWPIASRRMDSGGRKAKGREIEFSATESVMRAVEKRLELAKLAEEVKLLNSDDFLPPPPTLRLPGRHFESGKRLQERLRSELRTLESGDRTQAHPAILNGFDSLSRSLTAFDRSTCENIAWTQKYCPTSASEVLQGGKEAELLRDWLQTLKVQTVDTGSSDNGTANAKSGPAKKKRRKKLDNFIVSSDEEDLLMNEESDDESAWLPQHSHGSSRRTVVRPTSTKVVRFMNSVLLSGPHGSGKSATVYAIAKELDFEVFEISPGSRRNGKDIVEKIGDMTRNHQVSHKQEAAKLDDAINEDDVAREISTGKQGMMTAFFKPKVEPKAKAEVKPKGESEPPRKTSNKAQKQSLILLEEVDILYEEDKQFWATVIGLMAQSKRPFIMTCNNEFLVPLQNLALHGIFRFSAAPTDLAVDHLLLIAANEGHALSRDAVQALYESRRNDLRASISELNYWCQIGVGDPKGGFGWFYRKWPKGSDLDERGDRIRVVSSDTYRTGMGWLGRDPVSNLPIRYVQDEITRQVWESWGLDTSEDQCCLNDLEQVMMPNTTHVSRGDRIALLDAADSFYESFSAADIISQGALSSLNQVSLDPTLPPSAIKTKDDFIIGLQPIDAPLLSRYNTATFDMATSIRSFASSQLPNTNLTGHSEHSQLDENSAINKIRANIGKLASLSGITRLDYSMAFDPIAVSDKSLGQSSGHLDPSVFDRTMKMITLDVAPYVRSIVAYDQRLQTERLLRSNLLSEGGKPKKRMRSTRSAYSALEGGTRASTRREKYFSADINPHLVMKTGGRGWELLTNDVHTMNEVPNSPNSSAVDSDEMNNPIA